MTIGAIVMATSNTNGGRMKGQRFPNDELRMPILCPLILIRIEGKSRLTAPSNTV